MAKVVDTNLLLRYLTRDDPQKAEKVEKIFRDKRRRPVIPDIVMAEVVWVLSSVYSLTKEEVIEKVESMLGLGGFIENTEVIGKTLVLFKKFNIDWIDCYEAALVQAGKYSGIYSFDRDFDKISGIRRIEPK